MGLFINMAMAQRQCSWLSGGITLALTLALRRAGPSAHTCAFCDFINVLPNERQGRGGGGGTAWGWAGRRLSEDGCFGTSTRLGPAGAPRDGVRGRGVCIFQVLEKAV